MISLHSSELFAFLGVLGTLASAALAWAALRQAGAQIVVRKVGWIRCYKIEKGGYSFEGWVEIENIGTAATSIQAPSLFLSNKLCADYPWSGTSGSFGVSHTPDLPNDKPTNVVRNSGDPEQLCYIAGDGVMKTLRLEAGEVKTVTLRGIEIGASIPARWRLRSQEENVIHLVACIGFRYGRKEAKVTTGLHYLWLEMANTH